jgi:hypothetical protein
VQTICKQVKKLPGVRSDESLGASIQISNEASTLTGTSEVERAARIESFLKSVFHKVENARLLGSPGSGNVQNRNCVSRHELEQGLCDLVTLRRVEMKDGFIELLGESFGEQRTSREARANREDDRGVGISNVPFRALAVVHCGRGIQSIDCGYHPVLSTPSFGAPATVRNLVPDRPIQTCAVGTSLTA